MKLLSTSINFHSKLADSHITVSLYKSSILSLFCINSQIISLEVLLFKLQFVSTQSHAFFINVSVHNLVSILLIKFINHSFSLSNNL
ncbi:MAG: hypothetical protein Q8S84_04620 [bacterium]|nr:hypothetical protein [bacterium]